MFAQVEGKSPARQRRRLINRMEQHRVGEGLGTRFRGDDENRG